MLDLTLREFLDQLASKEPTPGGGSVAALTGALAAALGAMVCQLTIGKKKYAEHEDEMRRLLDLFEKHRATLTELVGEDSRAYEQLAAAYKLPRETPEEVEQRKAAIQAALGPAIDVPMRIAETSGAVMDLVPTLIQHGSQVAVSDAGMAALLSSAAIRSGAVNVLINLLATDDEEQRADLRRQLDSCLGARMELARSLHHEVLRRIEGA
ncbi:MAG: cyclodeaminase/cyclohydrolase family protein [Armatimonadetes bacterium]|nr:cyclodeaminase/cyclohydrolase family protein [Armatimonadota bacterium]